MSNIASLKPFQKGDDPRRNLKGRISKPLTEESAFRKHLLEYVHETITVNGVKTSRALLIAERIVDDAVRGNIRAIKLLMDRTEGKVRSQPGGGLASEYDPKEDKKLQAFVERMKEWDREAEERKKKEMSKNSTSS